MSVERRRRAVHRVAPVLVLLTFGWTSAQAADPPRISLNGYGTLGFVHSDEEQADFLGSLILENGAGTARNWSWEVDSRVGVQLVANLSSNVSAVVQVLAEQGSDGSYAPHVEWANVKFQISPDASVRAGRIVLPMFMFTDVRKVGFSNPWIRPPVELYALVPVTSNDGLDASYRISLGSFSTTFHGNFGQGDTELSGGGKAETRTAWGLTSSTERGDASFRLGYQETQLRIDRFNSLFDAFRQFGPEGDAIADRYDADGGTISFAGAGAQYDPGEWFVMAEVGRVRSSSAVGSRTAWYVSGGYRFDKLTPYLVYSTVDADSPLSDPGLTLAAYPPELRETAAALNGALDGILGSSPIQDTYSIGARWDFRRNFDFKLQFDHSELGAGSPGNLGNLQPGFEPGGSYELISVAVDFLF